MTDHRRKQLLINRRFQFSLIGKMLGVQLVLLAVAIAAVWMFADSEINTTLERAQASASSVRQILTPVLVTMGVVNAIIAAGITIFVVLIASHRIAGPLYRVQTALAEVEGGSLHPLMRIREEDQTGPLAEQLRETIGKVAADIEAAREGLSAAAEACRAAGVAIPPATIKATEALGRYTAK